MKRYKLIFYVPASHLDLVKSAVFSTGAGRIGHYDHCCWQTLGQGQFRPLHGSRPFIGEKDEVEYVEEYKVETLCDSQATAKEAVAALKKAHPYEEPAYDIWPVEI